MLMYVYIQVPPPLEKWSQRFTELLQNASEQHKPSLDASDTKSKMLQRFSQDHQSHINQSPVNTSMFYTICLVFTQFFFLNTGTKYMCTARKAGTFQDFNSYHWNLNSTHL